MADTLPFSVLCLLDTVVSGAGSRAGFHSLTTFTVACIQAAPTVVRATPLHLCPHRLHSPPEACKGHHSSSEEGRKPPCAKQRTMTTEGAKVGIPPSPHLHMVSLQSCPAQALMSGDKSVEEGCSALPHRIGAVCPPQCQCPSQWPITELQIKHGDKQM